MYVKQHVLVDGQPRIKPHRPDGRAAEQLGIGRGQQARVKQQGGERTAEGLQIRAEPRRQVVGGLDRTAAFPRKAEQNHVGVGGQGVQHGPQTGQKRIVGIQKQHPVPARGVQPGIAGRTRAAVCTMQRPNARVCGGQFVTECARVVGAAVVDEQDLQIGGCAGQGTVHRAAQRGRGPVAGDDDGNAHGCSSCKMFS